MLRRFADIVVQQGDKDFVIRKRIPPMMILGGIFVLAFLSVLLFVYNLQEWGGMPSFTALTFLIFGGLGWFTVTFVQRNRDLVMATEFQNALFAGAAGVGTKFCIIVRSDGNIIYYNPGFQKIFPGAAKGSLLYLDWILERGNVALPDKDKVHLALGNRGSVTVDFFLNDAEHIDRRLVLKVDPLYRPQGFSVIRAIDPAENGMDPELMLGHKYAKPLLEDLLNTLTFGLFTLTADGTFLFCNETFEMLLGFKRGDLIGRNISELIPPGGVNDYGLGDFNGQTALLNVTKDRVQLSINQQAMQENGQPIGYKALVQRVEAADKKKP